MKNATAIATPGNSLTGDVDLECLSYDLEVAETFSISAGYFFENIEAALDMADTPIAALIKKDVAHLSIVVGAMRDRVERAKSGLDTYIAAAPASQLRIEGVAA